MITGVAVLATIIPASVMADTGVQYVDSYGETSTCTKYKTVDASDHEWTTGWYVVENGTDNKVVFNDRIEINGNVNLILDDTVTLLAKNGIHVSPGNSLTVYGKTIDLDDGANKTNNLEAWMIPGNTDISGYAAIGGNAGEKNGTITFASGRISVYSTSDGGAGIGTGNYTSRAAYKADPANTGTNYGNIIILKAFVTAAGGYNAAAIGGGDYADSEGIIVKGGTVRAIGNYNQQQTKPDDALIGASGIGGGRGGCLFAFSMFSGDVIAASCGIGSGLGNGYDASPSSYHNRTIQISGGKLLALSNWGTAAMIGGKDDDMSLYGETVVQVYDSARIKYTDVEGWPEDTESANENVKVTLDINEYKNHNVIYVEPCPHEDHICVPSSASAHIEKCATCRIESLSEEVHSFDSENVCSVCGYETPVVFNVRAQLTGKITIVYAFRLSEDLKKDTNAYASFTSSGKTWTKKFKDMDYSQEDNAFAAFVYVDAMNLADSIVLDVYNGNGEKLPLISKSCTDYTQEGFSYSIKDYSEHIFSNPWYEDFAMALCNYGAMVCNYFKGSYGDWKPDLSALNAVTEETLAPYALKTNGKNNRPAGISKSTICVSFDSDNTLRITYYLTDDSEISNLSFLLDNEEYTPKKLADGVYAVDVENIAAPDLDVTHTFAVRDANKIYTIEASAMSYALTSIKSGKEKRVNLGKAFYLYNQEANNLFATPSN